MRSTIITTLGFLSLATAAPTSLKARVPPPDMLPPDSPFLNPDHTNTLKARVPPPELLPEDSPFLKHPSELNARVPPPEMLPPDSPFSDPDRSNSLKARVPVPPPELLPEDSPFLKHPSELNARVPPPDMLPPDSPFLNPDRSNSLRERAPVPPPELLPEDSPFLKHPSELNARAPVPPPDMLPPDSPFLKPDHSSSIKARAPVPPPELLPEDSPFLKHPLELNARVPAPNVLVETCVFSLSIDEFIKNRNDKQFAPELDWTSDGCSSSPDNPFGFDYLNSCYRHDFGYRNFKKQGLFTEAAKARIDEQFKKDMFAQCASEDLKDACEATATVYYEAVKAFGKKRAAEILEKKSVEARRGLRGE